MALSSQVLVLTREQLHLRDHDFEEMIRMAIARFRDKLKRKPIAIHVHWSLMGDVDQVIVEGVTVNASHQITSPDVIWIENTQHVIQRQPAKLFDREQQALFWAFFFIAVSAFLFMNYIVTEAALFRILGEVNWKGIYAASLLALTGTLMDLIPATYGFFPPKKMRHEYIWASLLKKYFVITMAVTGMVLYHTMHFVGPELAISFVVALSSLRMAMYFVFIHQVPRFLENVRM